MISITGIFNGKSIVPSSPVKAQPNTRVIITFLDDQTEKETPAKGIDWHKLAGSWQDERPAVEIINDIYKSRTSRNSEVSL